MTDDSATRAMRRGNQAATAVLLPDGWHEIQPGTLELDIEFGRDADSRPVSGFTFRHNNGGAWLRGPASSVQAVMWEQQ